MVEQITGSLDVMALSSGKAQSDRKTLPVDDRMDFGREAASGATETMISIPFCCRSLLVRPDGSAVDHLDVAIMRGGDGIHHPIPNARFSPAHEAIVASCARAIAFRQVAPRCAGSQYPEDAVQHAPVIDTRHASRLVGEQRR